MAIIKIGKKVIGMCATNCYFLYREGQSDCVVVDPADNGREIYTDLNAKGFHVAGILLTHGHFDHIWGLDDLRNACLEAYGEAVPAYGLEAEQELFTDAYKNVSTMAGRPCIVRVDRLVKDGDEITLAGITFRVIATPGHTIGGCCYYVEESGILLSGDTLFAESVGRTDFPTGSMSTLVRSIKDKLFVLPDETVVYPGHNEATSIEYEKQNNSFLG